MNHGLVQEGSYLTLRADAALTGSYVASSGIDLKSYDSLTVQAVIGTTQSATASLKFQWSMDSAAASPNWGDELKSTDGTASGGELPQTFNARRADLSMTTAGVVFTDRFRRLARYFRVVCKSSAPTTGTISIIVKPSVNSN